MTRPLALLALTYLGITALIAGLKQLIMPLLTMTDPSSYPLSLGIHGLSLSAFVHYQQLMTGSMMVLIPMLIVFFVFRVTTSPACRDGVICCGARRLLPRL